jgi:cobalt-zinc-cadmium efflux system membrane fusion protein
LTRLGWSIICAGILSACGRSKTTTPEDAGAAPQAAGKDEPRAFTLDEAQKSRITVLTVTRTPFRHTLEATANVQFNADRSTQVLAPMSGPVTRIVVYPGTQVRSGDVLATVSSPDFATAVADFRKAYAASRNADRILQQNDALFKNDALSRRELDQSRADAEAATADVEAAVQQLRSLGVDEKTIARVREGQAPTGIEAAIRAPLNGTVVEQLISPGQLLQAGTTPTFTVADLSTVWVMASVFESDLPDVHAGEDVEILTDASPSPLHARVDYVAALVDPASKATQVRIVAPNPGRLLKRDMFVRVRIHSSREHSGMLLPPSAIMRDDENLPFVFVAQANGGYVRRRVTLGGRAGEQYEILAGLSTGERVVADGALFIQFAESQ